MGSSEGPKEFVSSAEILPLNAPGVSDLAKFRNLEKELHELEDLKRRGLTDEEIKLYKDYEGGVDRNKIENSVLTGKLEYIYEKLKAARECEKDSDNAETEKSDPGTSKDLTNPFSDCLKTYPPGHPMNDIKQLEQELFDHLKGDEITPINKRRKLLRRLERKKEALESGTKIDRKEIINTNKSTMWDVREVPKKCDYPQSSESENAEKLIGPKRRSTYTIKNNKIVRLEPISIEGGEQNYRAVDIVLPENRAEERLLEGTKLSIDHIRRMERFKHYEPGNPSKVLFLKNISPQASADDISILFNQFVHENGAPVDVRLMSGRLRGQAFVHFRFENVAIQALEDVNGTIVKGRPVIAQFGKNSNNIQDR